MAYQCVVTDMVRTGVSNVEVVFDMRVKGAPAEDPPVVAGLRLSMPFPVVSAGGTAAERRKIVLDALKKVAEQTCAQAEAADANFTDVHDFLIGKAWPQ